jgi:NAD-dependent dihydropyrimidine dehydrogenase PreA subunit
MSEIRKEQKPGFFVPMIDRTKCEGGYHHACADAKCPCVPACPYGVLEIRPLTAEDKRLLSLGEWFRAWVHRNRQAYVVKADGCTACARCVQACPVPNVIKLRRQTQA